MLKLGVLLLLTSALTASRAPLDDWTFDGRDCRPGACTVDEGALRLCAPPGSDKRLDLERLDPERPTFARFVWHPGSLAAAKQLHVVFRYDQPGQHRVILDPANGVIRATGGLPEAAVPFAFGARWHEVEVVHSHNLKVYVDGVDEAHLVLDLPLAPEDQAASWALLQAFDDGSCHRFREVNHTPYTWDCLAGRCELDRQGLQLCDWGEKRLRWMPTVGEGEVRFAWDPSTFSVGSLTLFLRADAAADSRHAVVFDLWRGSTVRFADGLSGLPLPFSLEPGANAVVVTHAPNGLGLGEARVYVNDLSVPVASAAYHPAESAQAVEFRAFNGSGCHWLTQFAAPAA